MIDLSYLRQLMGGDEQMVARFVELFKKDMPRLLEVLTKAMQTGDWETANMTAHAIKGQLKYLKQEELAELAYEIEKQSEPCSKFRQPERPMMELSAGVKELIDALL